MERRRREPQAVGTIRRSRSPIAPTAPPLIGVVTHELRADAEPVRLDGLVFSGGPDLDPAVYGAPRHPRLGPDVDRVSDEHELALLAGAARDAAPALALAA
jgi:putative glutamine amidotransferase